MNRQRRKVLAILSAAAAGGVGPFHKTALAQGASGPLHILVGFPPGGATDTVARQLTEALSAELGRTIIVENKSGAGGMIATQHLKAAPADGSTVMITIDHTQVIIPLTFKSPGYEALADFTPLAGVTTNAQAMAVSGKLGIKTFREYETWVKAQPGRSSFGVPAVGSVPQFAGLLVGKAIGVDMVAVPYRGGAPLISDLIGAQVPMAIQSLAEQIEHHRRGTLRILAISGMERSRLAPDVPTFQELGVKGIERNSWIAFFGPKGLPRDFVTRFSRAVELAVQRPEVAEYLAKLGNDVSYASPEQLGEWVSSATKHWGAVIKESGFQLQ